MDKNIKKSATIYDIAKKANTSATTVSRVMSKSGYPVKESLRERILKAAEELNYSPNILAKNLKNNASRDIGVIIPTITNPFYPLVILGIEEEADKHDYNIILCNTFRDGEKEKKHLLTLYNKQVKGMIVSSTSQDNEIVNELLKKGVNLVLLDQKIGDLDCSIINFDYKRGAYMAVEHLIDCGHERIAFISTPLVKWTRKQAMEGYRQALNDKGIEFDDKYILIIEEGEEELGREGFEFISGTRLAHMYINNKSDATAVFAVNDMTAVGFIQQMQEKGFKIPQDVSVIGFNNIPMASMITPPLTTISYPSYELGKLACKLLLEKMDQGRKGFYLSFNLEPKLVVRKSVNKIT